ncbi:MAG: hypothetical protein ACNA8G_02095 [Gammaproteobacteria bacterium]
MPEVFPYELRYDLTLRPDAGLADVALTLGKGSHNIRWLRFSVDPARQDRFEADGKLERDGKYLTWTPPVEGGQLRFVVKIDHRRGQAFDARMTHDWALFRGDDVVPPARLLQEAGSEAEAELHVHLPEGWSFVSAFEELRPNVYRIENPERGFDRPTGWMAAGRLGIRRERIARVDVIVAGPLNQGVRHMDILAFMNWNLPRLRAIVDRLPERILIVSAREEMWRGGLSGPNSLYLHADRPLLSGNATSTLLHELVHVATRLRSRDGGDWIVEGLAEYYSLKLMWRSGTITTRRFRRGFQQLHEWGGDLELKDLDTPRARGPVTARAVLLFRELDREILRKSERAKSLDDVVKHLVSKGEPVSLEVLRGAVEAVLGERAETLAEPASM